MSSVSFMKAATGQRRQQLGPADTYVTTSSIFGSTAKRSVLAQLLLLRSPPNDSPCLSVVSAGRKLTGCMERG